MESARRYLLRNHKTGFFFKSDRVWTDKMQDAFDFGSHSRAIEVAYELRLQDVELLEVSFEGAIVGAPLKIPMG